VIIAKDKVIGWTVPNSSEATKKRLDLYLKGIQGIEEEELNTN